MAREIVIVWAGRHLRASWEELCEDYRSRIARSVPIRDVPIRVRSVDGPERRRAEGKSILGCLPDPAWLIALDEKGTSYDSVAFAAHFNRLRREWPHALVFVIGSDQGLADEVLGAAKERLSLGPLTLPHELARVVLYEQLFRALCMDAGINYHRA